MAQERTDRVIERNTGAIDRNTEAIDRNAHAFDRNAQAFERNTEAWGHTVGAMKAITASLNDMRGEIRAQTEAIYRVIDRMDDGRQGA